MSNLFAYVAVWFFCSIVGGMAIGTWIKKSGGRDD